VARPTNAARLDRAAEEAENLIRNRLVELTEAALNSALLPAEVTCAHCRKKFKLEGTSADTGLILKLLERVAGKATEKKDTGVSGELEKLLSSLSGVSSTEPTTAAEAAEAAKEKARRRAQLAAALKGAAVTPEA
jgi:hypothetical protein